MGTSSPSMAPAMSELRGNAMKAVAAAVVIVLGALSGLPAAGPASAGPTALTIEGDRQGPVGTFTTEGALTDAGTFTVHQPVFGGPGPGEFVNVHATETFTGAAGSFTLVRNMRVTWGDDPTVRAISGTWAVVAGSGAYEQLRARGTITGTVEGSPPAELFELTYAGSASTG